MDDDSRAQFKVLTGKDPFPWQRDLYDRFCADQLPARCDIPTGLGKTSVIAIWLLAKQKNASLPTRLVYVVNRRTVVDQTTIEVEKYRTRYPDLAISTLRGQYADNREWSADPSRLAVICGTVDMIGSRLLFNGYGVGFKTRPLHAGFLGQDSLIVHDEAHLEPAFQELLVAIQKEQRAGRFPDRVPMRVMELSATSRDDEADSKDVVKLTDKDRADPTVQDRIGATKRLQLHPQTDAKPGTQLVKLAIDAFKDSGRAVLIFTRTIDDIKTITDALVNAKLPFEQLIGPMRGWERERLTDSDVFKRFLPDANPGSDTVYLVCTSAGEVGVNISADHLVCDLSTFESMTQRLGRVNRFGKRTDSEIHVVSPTEFGKKDKETGKIKADEIDKRRKLTRDLLMKLPSTDANVHDASPAALSDLPEADRLAAFAPPPTILPTSDILFDAWAMTSIRDKMPGRPPVEPYLHGIRDYEPPETKVAWRQEVGVITGDLLDQYPPEDLLDEYPLKPHELLGDRSDRVHKELATLAKRFGNRPVWIVDQQGKVTICELSSLEEKSGKDRIANATILLPYDVGGLTPQGLLDGDFPLEPKRDESRPAINNDVADIIKNKDGQPLRIRIWDDDKHFDAKSEGMRRILPPILLPGDETDEDAMPRAWHWFERPIDKDNSKNAIKPVLLDDHVNDVVTKVKDILSRLTLDAGDEKRDQSLKDAIMLAAKFHDLGKARELWQRSIGRPLCYGKSTPPIWFGKSGRRWKPRKIGEYRHEFGSLVDLQSQPEFQSLDDDSKDLVQHLIAAHHGQARPHFAADQIIDPNHRVVDCEPVAIEVPRRFARLQRKFGRWGLAYIESLLRAADWHASAAPSKFHEETGQ